MVKNVSRFNWACNQFNTSIEWRFVMELVKAFLILIAIFLAITLIQIIIRKSLHMNIKDIFTNRHVNSLHKKINWYMGGIGLFLWIVLLINTSASPSPSFHVFLWFIIVWALLDFMIYAFFTLKYTSKRKEILVHFAELTIWIAVVVTVINFNIFGLSV